jgi:hypothetical protein
MIKEFIALLSLGSECTEAHAFKHSRNHWLLFIIMHQLYRMYILVVIL